MFICLRPTPLIWPQTSPPPRQTVLYSTIHTGKGGGRGVEPKRWLEGQQFTKLGWIYQHDWLQCINSALQMKGWWESNINVRFPFMHSQKWNCAASLFPKQNYMFCLPIPPLIYICKRLIYFQSVCLFFCSQICGLILGIYKLLADTWM